MIQNKHSYRPDEDGDEDAQNDQKAWKVRRDIERIMPDGELPDEIEHKERYRIPPRVSEGECQVMRQVCEYLTADDLALVMEYTRSTIRYHAIGSCSHSHDDNGDDPL